MESFASIWNYLQGHLEPGTKIRNWTILHGYLDDMMNIEAVVPEAISLSVPTAKSEQIVPKKDFESVWKLWGDYKLGKVLRYEIRNITRYSKYIISIFHWYEEEENTPA